MSSPSPSIRVDTVQASPQTVAPWSDHWRRTLTGSIDLQGADPVAQALRGLWAQRVTTLKACHQIVDVGSGPAILARLMASLDWTLAAPTTWWCIDQAQLGLGWQQSMPSGVRVREQTRFEDSLPLEGPVDALVSNFGLEYVGLQALVLALPRWLKPHGQLEAVLHARGSLIDVASREHAADLRLALHEVELPKLGAALVEALATAPSDPLPRMMHGVEVRDAYNAGVDRLKQVMEERGRPSAVLMDLLHGFTHTLRQVTQIGADAAVQQMARQGQAYETELARLTQMQASALDDSEVGAWRSALQAALSGHRTLSVHRVECPLGLVAWNLSTAP